MLIVNKLIPQARGLAPVLLKRATTVELGWDLRQKSRFDAVDSAGRLLGFFLPRGGVVRGGDAGVAEDGSIVVVKAAPQPLMVVRPCPEHGAPGDLLRAAYHLGNRHVAVELSPEALKFEPDPVLAGMLRRQHLIVTEEMLPFEPEGGAYAGGGGHAAHDPGGHPHHDHEHDHESEAQGHEHHDHEDHGHEHGHGHGPHR